jgi:PiT family inorganic phosphate transporter
VKWSVAERMVWAWVMTLPITAAISYVLQSLLMVLKLA